MSLTFIATRVFRNEFRYIPHHVIDYDPAVILAGMLFDLFDGNNGVCHLVR